MNLYLADPRLLWVVVPVFVLWLAALTLPRWLGRGRRDAALRFSSLSLLRDLGPSPSLLLRRVFQALRVLSVALLLIALLRPQTGRTLTQVDTEGIDIMLVLDTSGSMQALDLDADREIRSRRNRLDVAKEVVERFVAGRGDDLIGLVVFGEEAFTQCPLTLDHDVLGSFLQEVEIGVAGDATALGDAVGTAVKRLRDSEAESKVIILLTDGVNNAGSLAPMTAAEIAETLGVKIYAIGAGVRGEAPFLVQTAFGSRVVYQANMIDEESLEAMAARTGGRYFRAEDAEALEAIYEEIDRLEKTEITMERYTEYEERYRWLVVPAILLLLVEILALGTRWRKLP